MTDEEWEATQHGMKQMYGAAPATTADPSSSGDGGYLGSALAFGKGMAREGAKQIGVAKDFAEGSDPEHSTAEWLGRKTTDFAPAVAIDALAPEFTPFTAATQLGRLGNFANEVIYSSLKGAAGGAAANPDDRMAGAKTGALTGGGSTAAGGAIRAAHPALWPAAIGAELMHHGIGFPFVYPWAMVHGISALGALARAAGKKVPATAGAVGSQVQQGAEGQ